MLCLSCAERYYLHAPNTFTECVNGRTVTIQATKRQFDVAVILHWIACLHYVQIKFQFCDDNFSLLPSRRRHHHHRCHRNNKKEMRKTHIKFKRNNSKQSFFYLTVFLPFHKFFYVNSKERIKSVVWHWMIVLLQCAAENWDEQKTELKRNYVVLCAQRNSPLCRADRNVFSLSLYNCVTIHQSQANANGNKVFSVFSFVLRVHLTMVNLHSSKRNEQKKLNLSCWF